MIEIDKKYYRLIRRIAKQYELKMKYFIIENEKYCHNIHVDVKEPVEDGISFTMISQTPMTPNDIENDIIGWLKAHRPKHLRKIKIKSFQDSDD